MIYTIKPGDSLWNISRKYGIPIETIREQNEMRNQDKFVVGQTLVLLGRDGSRKARPFVEVGAYIDPRVVRERSAQTVDQVGQYLTYLNIFTYAVNRNGSLEAVEDEPSLGAASRHGVTPLLVLANYENGQFSTELATAILTQEAVQDRLIEEAIRIMRVKGYRGIDFDFEYLGAANRQRYVQFLRKVAYRIKPLGYTLSVAIPPKTSDRQSGVLVEGADYAGIGEVVDFMFIMTYEWGWSGGPPGAVSPLNLVTGVLRYAVSQVPRRKILLGIPLYGYDWTLPYVPGGRFAKAISPVRGVELAHRYNERIRYDETAQAPWFRYRDEQRRTHEVWFEDARSIQAKFDLVKAFGLRGFFYWALGFKFPQNWLLIEDNFMVTKRS